MSSDGAQKAFTTLAKLVFRNCQGHDDIVYIQKPTYLLTH